MSFDSLQLLGLVGLLALSHLHTMELFELTQQFSNLAWPPQVLFILQNVLFKLVGVHLFEETQIILHTNEAASFANRPHC